MHKNKTSRFVILMLLVSIITMILVSGTFAKYTREYNGTSTATVAKFKVGEISSASLNLFETIKEVDATTTEQHVKSGKIAPGTGGKFTITLTNESEVAVAYQLEIEEKSNVNNVPIEYSVDGTTYVTAENLLNQANSQGTLAMENGTADVVVYWRWAFDGQSSTNYTSSQTDITDTTLGETAQTTAPTVEIEVSATYTQID